MEPIDPNEWLRAVVIDECNDLQFLVIANGKVLLSKRKWLHMDMVGDFEDYCKNEQVGLLHFIKEFKQSATTFDLVKILTVKEMV